MAFAALERAEADIVKLKEEVAMWKRKRTGTSGKLDPAVRRMLEDIQRLGKVSTTLLNGKQNHFPILCLFFFFFGFVYSFFFFVMLYSYIPAVSNISDNLP
jgi:hypothetical protein